MPNIYKKDNKLSAYGFLCGYIHKVEYTDRIWKEICMEHRYYQVRFIDLDNRDRDIWESFELNKDAWNCFNKLKNK